MTKNSIYEHNAGAVSAVPFVAEPTLEEILEADCLARQYVRAHLSVLEA
jgi:hypothetical protein